MYRRILVPVDGSSTASRGLREALRLARAHKARLVLLHLVQEFFITRAGHAPNCAGLAPVPEWLLRLARLHEQGAAG